MLKKKNKHIVNENKSDIQDIYDDEYVLDKNQQEKNDSTNELSDDLEELEQDNEVSEEVVNEATTLNKKEEAITDPKELEPIIKRWEKAVSGEEPIINKKTNKPLTTDYCKDKLRLLKKKMGELKSGSSNESSNDEQKQQIEKTLQATGFSKDKDNVFVNKEFEGDIAVGISFNESISQFDILYKHILLEESQTITSTLKVKNFKTGKEETINDFKFDPTIDPAELKKQIDQIIADKNMQASDEQTSSEETADLPEDIDQTTIEERI